MKILISGMMGPGTLEAKIEPLAQLEQVEEIIFVRKSSGPALRKVKYHILPKICSYSGFHMVLTPLIIFWVQFKNKADLIIAYHIIPYAFFTAVVSLATNTPYVIGQTGLLIEKKSMRNFFKPFLKIILKRSRKVHCPGKNSVRHWEQIFPEIQGKFNVLHSTINTDFYKTASIKKKQYDFIFLGRLHRIKNIDLIIKALSKLNSRYELRCNLQIVGDGPEEESLTELTKKLNMERIVHFKGFIDNPVPYLSNSKFLIMASVSEGLPTAMMQAMACEVIPVTNLVGNIPDLVRDEETGFVFEDLIVDDLVKALQRAIRYDQNSLKKIKSNCRDEIIKNHSHETAIKKWRELFQEINIK